MYTIVYPSEISVATFNCIVVILLVWNLSVCVMLSCSYILRRRVVTSVHAHIVCIVLKTPHYTAWYITHGQFLCCFHYLLPLHLPNWEWTISEQPADVPSPPKTDSYCNYFPVFVIKHKCISWPVHLVIMVGHLVISSLSQSDASCRNVFDHMLESHWLLSWWCDKMWTSPIRFFCWVNLC